MVEQRFHVAEKGNIQAQVIQNCTCSFACTVNLLNNILQLLILHKAEASQKPGMIQLVLHSNFWKSCRIPRPKCSCWIGSLFKRAIKTQQSSQRAKTNKAKLLLCTWVVWQVMKAVVALRSFVPMKGLTVQNDDWLMTGGGWPALELDSP